MGQRVSSSGENKILVAFELKLEELFPKLGDLSMHKQSAALVVVAMTWDEVWIGVIVQTSSEIAGFL